MMFKTLDMYFNQYRRGDRIKRENKPGIFSDLACLMERRDGGCKILLLSSEKHLLSQFTAPFTSPNWSMSEREEALAFYHHIDLQEMKSYALTLQKPHNIITFYLSGM